MTYIERNLFKWFLNYVSEKKHKSNSWPVELDKSESTVIWLVEYLG